MKKKFFLLVFSLLCAGIVNAAILNVPAEYSTIQTGIDSSSVGDTVLVQPGTYVENINYNGKNITVASLFLTTQDTSYISQTVIDGNNAYTVVKFNNGEDSTAVLCGFTITNGYADFPNENGGGISCTQGSCPILCNLIIFSNFSEGWGGGISCRNGSNACIKSTKIYNNHADNRGGGLSCYIANPTLTNVVIFDNFAEFWGGGVNCQENSSPQLNYVVISNNSAVFCGGGIALQQNSSPIFNNVQILNNCCEDDESMGGGLYVTRSSASLLGATINQNTATHGGAIYCALNAIVEISNSYFFENISYCNAGCILCDDSDIFMKSCTINNSDAFSYGGALFIWDSSYVKLDSVALMNNVSSVGGGINIENSTLDIYCSYLFNNSACDGGAIISFNSDLNIFNSLFVENGTYEGGSAIDARNSTDVYCCNVTITNNYAQTSCGGIKCDSNSELEMYNSILWNDTRPEIIGNNVSVLYSDIQGGWIGTGNINNDPQFADTLSEDFHLTQDSPCIDTGIPDTTGLNIPPWDMDGNIRVWDGNGSGVAIIDMGAYEYGSPSYSIHEPEIPNKSIIYNFPNPTKNSTTIKYSLKQNSHVTISIYNLKGQLVETFIDATKPKGEYSKIYNTETLSSGVYFYKIQTEDISEIKKMIVIK